mmetsp:Transcript_18536/g.27222  ORF Transcript_18536/g.27222 Transcript_18536/m.27222 type:complete len:227 (-) Transcript_18536:957-1637(-)
MFPHVVCYPASNGHDPQASVSRRRQRHLRRMPIKAVCCSPAFGGERQPVGQRCRVHEVLSIRRPSRSWLRWSRSEQESDPRIEYCVGVGHHVDAGFHWSLRRPVRCSPHVFGTSRDPLHPWLSGCHDGQLCCAFDNPRSHFVRRRVLRGDFAVDLSLLPLQLRRLCQRHHSWLGQPRGRSRAGSNAAHLHSLPQRRLHQRKVLEVFAGAAACAAAGERHRHLVPHR